MQNNPLKKTGLFLCKCGTNIANFIDLEQIAIWAKNQSDIHFVTTHDLLCSPAGKAFVEDAIKRNDLESVVIAACSVKMHEKTFQNVAVKSGRNIADLQMANVREQAAWVTSDKVKATEKTKALITAAVKRVALHQTLTQQYMECRTDVVIIGGGIAGIEAALMAANAGRSVTIIEREISLGGNIIKTEEVAPSMECAPCLLAPRLAAVKDHKNIKVVSNAGITAILGFLGNFVVKAHQKARFVKDNCIGCEACFEVCPVSVASDFHMKLGNRKAIYTAFPGSVPATAVIDKTSCKHFTDGSCGACVEVCPFQSIDFAQQDTDLEIPAGAVILATGADIPDMMQYEKLGYGRIPHVYTTAEFERIACSNGPYGGDIQMKNGKKPASIAVIHCAGSLREDGLHYCSGICCMNSCKVGDLVRKKIPDAIIYNIHDRLVFPNTEAGHFYEHQKNAGTRFVKSSKLEAIDVAVVDDMIVVTGDDFNPVTVDMVVLSTGNIPARGTEQIAEFAQTALTGNGFFKPDHAFLHATGASIDGIYAVGSCSAPAAVSTAVTQAQAAVGDVLSKLIPGRKIELELMPTVIDSETCAGCKLCIAVCPYSAIRFDAEKNICKVNEALCRGCGTCAATCPGKAASAVHFTNKQIYAEIEGVLHEKL